MERSTILGSDSNENQDDPDDTESHDSSRKNLGNPDIIIVCGKREFQTHKSILIEISQYFKSMFSSEWKETATGRVELHTISEEVMEVIIEFVYAETLPDPVDGIAWDLYVHVLEAAHLLEITSLFLRCLQKLADCMNLNNFMKLLHVAELFDNGDMETKNVPRLSSEGLTARINTFLAQSFSQYSETADFLKMDADQLKFLLQHPELEVVSLPHILGTLIKWVEADLENRKVDLEGILLVLDSCFGESIGELVNCWSSNLDVKSFQKTLQEKQPKTENCKSCRSSIVQEQKLLFYGGYRIAPYKRLMKTYDIPTGKWQAHNHPPFPVLDGVEAVAYSGHVYFFGVLGWMKVYSMAKVTTYCPLTNSVVSTGSLKYPVRVCGAVGLHGSIYVVGIRQTATQNVNVVQHFWPATGKCDEIANIDDDTTPADAYVWKNHIYVVTYSIDHIHMYLVCYEPLTDQWTLLTNVPKKFSSFTYALFDEKFLLMKQDNKCEYNVVSNKWEETKFNCGPITVEEMWTIWQDGKRLLLVRDKDFTLATFDLQSSQWHTKINMAELMQNESFNSRDCGLLKCVPY